MAQTTIYVELRLDGTIKIYEHADHILLLIYALQARAACLPVPDTIDQAHEYIRANCHQLEMFESIDHLETWICDYQGFRAQAAYTEFLAYQQRRREFLGIAASVAA
jgi:hypothetical protein